MNKKNSSYYRLFRFALLVVIIVVILIGVVIVSVVSSSYKQSKLRDLQSVGELFSDSAAREPDASKLAETQKMFMDRFNVRIYIYGEDGLCILPAAPGESSAGLFTASFNSDILPVIENDGFYLNISSARFSQSEPAILYAAFRRNAPNSGKYILVYGGTDDLNSFTFRLAFFYLLFAVIGIYAAYLLLKRRIKKHMDFESEFLRISEMYSKGDFSEKLSADIPGNLKEISAYVNALAANVETSEETSKTFIANVSHELRTPITTIGGFVDGILDGTIKKSRQQEYLVLVSQEIQRLRVLITSMLNMTRFESGTMSPNFKETNLTDLVIKVVLMFEKRIEEKHLEVEELDSSRLVAVVDADLMQQVIYNLVENAVKFVNDGGTLSFRFDKKDDICIIGIRNTGEGLKNTEIQQVFDRFYKADSSRGKDTTGLGIGLSISRKIVHLHKGHIVVKSVYGEYTEFQIQIPEDPTKRTKSSGKIL